MPAPAEVTIAGRWLTVGRAALIYWALVFSFAFVIGVVRTMWLAPLLGSAVLAVLLELPLVLTASWWVARRIVTSNRLGCGESAAMGAVAFTLLMVAELALATFVFGETTHGWFSALFGLPGALGLAGQLGFAVIPVLVNIGHSPVGSGKCFREQVQ